MLSHCAISKVDILFSILYIFINIYSASRGAEAQSVTMKATSCIFDSQEVLENSAGNWERSVSTLKVPFLYPTACWRQREVKKNISLLRSKILYRKQNISKIPFNIGEARFN